MKNIFKLFALIAGLSLCMMESPEQAMTTIKVNFVSGNALVELQVPVSQGTFTKSDLMTAFEQDQERTTELCKIMDASYLVIRNKMVSEYQDDAKFPIEEEVQVVTSWQKVTLRFGGTGSNKESLVTLYGNLRAIFDDEAITESIGYICSVLQRGGTIHEWFLRINCDTVCYQISQYLTKITTSSGQVFIKDLARCSLADHSVKHTALPVFNTLNKEHDVTQEKIDFGTIKYAWMLSTND